jgi:hypothetical protein
MDGGALDLNAAPALLVGQVDFMGADCRDAAEL